MKKEDIEFLRELQHELRTQETDGEAPPRYWGIEQSVEVACPEDCADHEYILIDGEKKTKDEIVAIIEEDLQTGEPGILEFQEDYDMIDKTYIDDLCYIYNKMYKSDAKVIYTRDDLVISNQSGCFLTKRAARKHIETNAHHYNEPHTFAMTAWRNPEFERFMRIFETMDINDIKTDN